MCFSLAIALIVAAATLRIKPFRFQKINGPVKFISERTYTLYLCHILTIKAAEKIIYGFFPSFPPLVFMTVAAVFALMATTVLYELIEKPLIASLRSWMQKYRQRKPVA
jgi:peptidoglycan/LPS O-acetylase OafA/YrhL